MRRPQPANVGSKITARQSATVGRSPRFRRTRSSAWFAIALGQPLLKRNDMKSSDGHAGVVIEPHNNASPGWIDTGVIGTRHGVAFAATRNNREGLERSRFKMLSNIANHAFEYSSAPLTSAIDKSSSRVPLLLDAMMGRANVPAQRTRATDVRIATQTLSRGSRQQVGSAMEFSQNLKNLRPTPTSLQ